MQADIAIVVAAYNRPESLERLLSSIARADYNGYNSIALIISLDFSGNDDCEKLGAEFTWSYGEKKLVTHRENLGLKEHILSCGQLSKAYDAIIMLEDDLLVSPAFYDYAQQAFQFYKNAEDVAGIALYSNCFNETGLCSFEPVHDGFDNYFMQVPCSWGQLWTRKQWEKFSRFSDDPTVFDNEECLPTNVQVWQDASSWKKMQYRYLLTTGYYYVYPRIGLSSNYADAGKHLQESMNVFQCPLLLQPKAFRFSLPEQSLSLYDAYCELQGVAYNKITSSNLDISFDLNGTKSLSSIKTTWLVSAKKCPDAEGIYETSLYPYENNILFGRLNSNVLTGFAFGKTNSFSESLGFNRKAADIKRVFMSESSLVIQGRKEVEKTSAYIWGMRLLKPFDWFKRLGNK